MTHWLITLTKSQIHGLRKENAPYYKPPPMLHIICLPFSFFFDEIIVKMFCVNHNNFCHFFTKRLMLFAFKEKEEAEEYL
ncbi:hypothetical protein T08_11635, partial [Trichinella sp. T8]